jgi:hypothetical protein
MNYNQYKKGDIVKIIKGDPHNNTGFFLGLTSELIKPPTKYRYGWHFEMLYGNWHRKEYSEMNFYAEDIIAPVTAVEKKLYLFMKTIDVSLLTDVELYTKRLREDNLKMYKYKIGNDGYLNLFNNRIYVNTEAGLLELYNAELGSWAIGTPVEFTNLFVIDTDEILGAKNQIFVPRLKKSEASSFRGFWDVPTKEYIDSQVKPFNNELGMDPSILLL